MNEKICAFCGKTFFPKRIDARFCGGKCRSLYHAQLATIPQKVDDFVAFVNKMTERAESDPVLSEDLHKRVQGVQKQMNDAAQKLWRLNYHRHQAAE